MVASKFSYQLTYIKCGYNVLLNSRKELLVQKTCTNEKENTILLFLELKFNIKEIYSIVDIPIITFLIQQLDYLQLVHTTRAMKEKN